MFILGTVALACVGVVLVVADIRMYQKRNQLNAQIENMERKIRETKQNNDELEQAIAHANDQQYIEKVAREELALQKPGEQVVSFIAAEATENKNSQPPSGFFRAWLGWLGEWFR